VLLIHGGEDRRAPVKHAEALRQALAEKGNPPGWLLEPREGHGFYDEGARERMYARLVAFLRENTGLGTPGKVSASAPGSDR
jgi:dipeptidyl aminopeptidase/acylaminoacyl peptidase